jgi:hypothetical protein
MIEEHRDRSEPLLNACYSGIDRRLVGDIGDPMFGNAACGANSRGCFCCGVAIAVNDCNLRSLGSEKSCCCPAYAGGAAGAPARITLGFSSKG